MKKVKYAILAAALALTAAGCMKTEQNYTPNPQYPGDNLYFPADAPTKVELDKDQPLTFDIIVYRGGDTTDPLDAALTITGEAIDENYITIEPALAKFAAGESTAKVTATVDGDKLGLNKPTTFNVAIADKSQTSPVGDASLTYTVSIPLPWLVFGTGTLTECPDWWDETETKTLYYQEVSPTLWLCKLPQCWGHDTMEGGKPYDCQDYMFYWDKTTDYLYVCYGYMGYTDSDGMKIYVCTMADYYIAKAYLAGQTKTSPEDAGTDEWFALQDFYLNGVYGPADRPHYDGNGGFYLGDSYLCDQIAEGGKYVGKGYTGGGTPDTFICDGFERFDYTIAMAYKGMYVPTKGEAAPILNFTGTADVKGVKYVLTNDAGADFDAIVASIIDGTATGVTDITLAGGEATDTPEITPGVWIAIAVPYGADDVLHGDYAVQMKFNFKGLNPTPAVENLVEGYYSYVCDNSNEGAFLLSAVDATHYTVSGLGIGDATAWNAVYDKDNGTLTLDGTIKGKEDKGNMFGYLLGWFNKDAGYVYTLESYASDESEGDDPIEFEVDTATGELTAVHPEIYVSVYVYETGQYVGDYNAIEDGATVEFLQAPQTASVTLARSTGRNGVKSIQLKATSSSRVHNHSFKNATMAPLFGYWNGLTISKPTKAYDVFAK